MSDIPKKCDHTSVGAIIRDHNGHVLTFERATPPPGIAGPAGHIDDHGGPEAAVLAEVSEEVGLTVIHCALLAQGFRPGVCRRPGSNVGHDWWIFEVETEGELAPSDRETRHARWRSPAELQELAACTVAYARLEISAEDFAADPGIEPVWLSWFSLFGVIDVTTDELWTVDTFLRREAFLREGGPS